MRQRVALVATLARLYVGVVLIDRERECRGHRRRIVGVVYDHMCQQQCDQRIGYAAGLRPGNMSQIGARSAYLALRDFDPANVSCGSFTTGWNHQQVQPRPLCPVSDGRPEKGGLSLRA